MNSNVLKPLRTLKQLHSNALKLLGAPQKMKSNVLKLIRIIKGIVMRKNCPKHLSNALKLLKTL